MREAGDLKVERAETGFIVYEDAGVGLMGRKWAFETPEKLSDFIEQWAVNEPEEDEYRSQDAN